MHYIYKQISRTKSKKVETATRSSKIESARERDQRLLNRSLRREDALRMNSHSLQRDTNKVAHEAAFNRLLKSIGHANIMRIRVDPGRPRLSRRQS